MSGKTSLTLFHCLMGPALIAGGLWLATRAGERDPLAGLLVTLAALVLPVVIVTRVAWAAGYVAGWRDRASHPSPADGVPPPVWSRPESTGSGRDQRG